MLGNTLITKQTGVQGTGGQHPLRHRGGGLGLSGSCMCPSSSTARAPPPIFIGSAEGGTGIEELAKTHPEKIKTMKVNISEGIDHDACVAYAKELGFTGDSAEKAANQFKVIYNIGKSKDCTMVEINPFIELENGDVMEIDAKLSFDDNAAFRQKEIFALADDTQIDSKEVLAKKFDLNYIALDGNVGCLVNGAGLAMATMDLISLHGGSPANFLDVGGSAEEKQIVAAFRIITGDPNVKSILVNIFGGIMHCDVIAKGVVNAAKTLQTKVPIVVRLNGTNEEAGKQIIAESGMDVHTAEDFESGAKLAVELAVKGK
ncbi:succinyl-CoA synthetase beta subunit [Angomonas deanei]|nr:succinyl-CoA synthetase beta subunit [Angomonas deanei]|eukprot:EPY34080.1 succinyl-CoA synthetase beta subunit [Angomonas deanei]